MRSLQLQLLALLGFGCAENTQFAIPSQCATASECEPGYICTNFRCSEETGFGPDEVSLELIPPSGSGLARYQQVNISVADLRQPLVVSLPAPARYRPQVLDASGQEVAALFSVYGQDRIPGREAETTQRLIPGANAAILHLVEGAYLVRLRPTDARWPGMEVPRFLARAQDEVVLRQFRLPNQYRRLYGEVTSSISGNTKLSGVIVRAYSEASGLSSTTTVTDALGRYEILLPETEDTFFRVVAEPSPLGPASWSFDQQVRVGLDVREREFNLALEPTDQAVRGTLELQIFGLQGSTAEPIGNAQITLTSTFAQVAQAPVYRVQGVTDAAGYLTVTATRAVPMLKGTYRVEVRPPRNSKYARTETLLDLTSIGPNFTLPAQITLAPKTPVTGLVVAHTGALVTDGRLEVEPLTSGLLGTDAPLNGAGRYGLALEPGRYLLVARPQGDLNLPVGTTVIEVADVPLSVPTLTLPRGGGLALSVNVDGEVLPNTQAELFIRREGRTVSLGRARTDAAGRATLVVPVSDL